MDHVLDYMAGILDEVHDGKQDLAVGLAELLDDGSRLARSAGHDVIRFFHGGRLLSDSCLATGFYRIGSQPPPTNLQLNSGHLHVTSKWINQQFAERDFVLNAPCPSGTTPEGAGWSPSRR